MKKTILIILLVLPCTIFANRFPGMYVGGQWGYVNPHRNLKSDEGWQAWRGFAGLKFNKNFAIEAGYNSFARKYNKKLSGVDVVAYARTMLHKPFFAFIKGGFIRMHQKLGLVNSNRFMPLVGFGVGFDFLQHFSTDVSWTRIVRVGPIDKLDFVGFGLKFILNNAN